MTTKLCQLCRKEIQLDAQYCPYCGYSFSAQREKWYLRTSTFWIAVLVVGPFALPLLWLNQKISIIVKAVVSIIVLALSYYLGVLFIKSLNAIIENYKIIFAL